MDVQDLDGGLIFGWTSQVFWTRDTKKQDIDDKTIYSASNEAEDEFNLEMLAEKWNAIYLSISRSWRSRLLTSPHYRSCHQPTCGLPILWQELMAH